jgi:hypothetical protein
MHFSLRKPTYFHLQYFKINLTNFYHRLGLVWANLKYIMGGCCGKCIMLPLFVYFFITYYVYIG